MIMITGIATPFVAEYGGFASFLAIRFIAGLPFPTCFNVFYVLGISVNKKCISTLFIQ